MEKTSHKLTVGEAARLIYAAHLNPEVKPLSFLLVGASGIGKTQLIEGMAKQLGAEYVNIRAPEMEPPDMMGYFNLDKEVYVNSLFPKTDKPAFILLDEVNRASPSMQNACMRILEGRGTNTYRPGLMHTVIGAANPMTDNDYVEMFGRAALNRPYVIFVEPDLKEWINYIRLRKVSIEDIKKYDPQELKEKVQEYLEKIIMFLLTYPQHFQKEATVEQTQNLEGTPNPRNWEEAAKIIVLFDVAGVERNIAARIATKVGFAAAAEFANFLVDPEPPVSGEEILNSWNKVKDKFVKHQKTAKEKAIATIVDFCTVVANKDDKIIDSKMKDILDFINSIDKDVQEIKYALLNSLPTNVFNKIILSDKTLRDTLFKDIMEIKKKFQK